MGFPSGTSSGSSFFSCTGSVCSDVSATVSPDDPGLGWTVEPFERAFAIFFSKSFRVLLFTTPTKQIVYDSKIMSLSQNGSGLDQSWDWFWSVSCPKTGKNL